MLRLPVSHLAAALIAVLPLAAQAQAAADSVVRTTTVTTITTTTVVKPASGEKPGPATTTSSTTSATTTTPAPAVATRPKATPVRPAPVASSAKATAKAAPAAKRVATTQARPATAAVRRPALTDPELADMIKEDVDLSKVTADQLNSIYERFIETTRAERRQWTSAQWETASTVLSRLNQRYDQLRPDISLEDKVNIRTIQGEFHGLKTAKAVSKSL